MNQAQAIINTKGQFVIPVAMRKYWDISPNSSVNITSIPDIGIIIKPTPTTPPLTDEEFMQILEETKGSMIAADWEETEKRLNILAKQELKELKANAW